MNLSRSKIVVSSVAAVMGMTCSSASAAETAKIIKVSARKFEYVPREVKLTKGVPVVLQLTTEDRSHGFNIPAMNLRADVLPGKITELKLTPQKTGEYEFFCDVFCGSGHEGMNGKITVTD
jgi:cytochrome c oxidase subunit 2